MSNVEIGQRPCYLKGMSCKLAPERNGYLDVVKTTPRSSFSLLRINYRQMGKYLF
jgi:hypothetical protein